LESPNRSYGGTFLEWSRRGNELLYRSPDSHIMIATYTTKGDYSCSRKTKTVVRQAGREWGRNDSKLRRWTRCKAHRGTDAHRGRNAIAEPRDLSRELLRRAATAGAGEVASDSQLTLRVCQWQVVTPSCDADAWRVWYCVTSVTVWQMKDLRPAPQPTATN